MPDMSRSMVARECIKLDVFDDADLESAKYHYAMIRVGRVCRQKDNEGRPEYANTQEKAADGNPVVKPIAEMMQEEFTFVLDSRWTQIGGYFKTTERMELQFEMMFDLAYVRKGESKNWT